MLFCPIVPKSATIECFSTLTLAKMLITTSFDLTKPRVDMSAPWCPLQAPWTSFYQSAPPVTYLCNLGKGLMTNTFRAQSKMIQEGVFRALPYASLRSLASGKYFKLLCMLFLSYLLQQYLQDAVINQQEGVFYPKQNAKLLERETEKVRQSLRRL